MSVDSAASTLQNVRNPGTPGVTVSVAGCKVPEEDLAALYEDLRGYALHDAQDVVELDFSGNSHTGEALSAVLGKALRDFGGATRLLLGGNDFSTAGLEQVAACLQANGASLTSLSLRGAVLAASFPPMVYGLLGTSSGCALQLRTLVLDDIPSAVKAVKMLKRPTTTPTALTSLSLARVGLKNDDLAPLSELFSRGTLAGLRSLNLDGNADLTCTALLEFVQGAAPGLQGLTSLDLSNLPLYVSPTNGQGGGRGPPHKPRGGGYGYGYGAPLVMNDEDTPQFGHLRALAAALHALAPPQGGLERMKVQSSFVHAKPGAPDDSKRFSPMLAAALATLCGGGRLKSVDVRRNKLQRSDLEALCAGLLQEGEGAFGCLEVLRLDYNRISHTQEEAKDAAGQPSHLVTLIAQARCLRELTLVGARLALRDMDDIREAVAQQRPQTPGGVAEPHPLRMLNISKNHFKATEAFDTILPFVRAFPKLEGLYMDEISCLKQENDAALRTLFDPEAGAQLHRITLGGNFIKGCRVANLLGERVGSVRSLDLRGTPQVYDPSSRLQKEKAVQAKNPGVLFSGSVVGSLLLSEPFRALQLVCLDTVVLPMQSLCMLADYLQSARAKRVQHRRNNPLGPLPLELSPKRVFLDYTYAGSAVKVSTYWDQKRFEENPFHFFGMLRGKFESENDLNFANLDLQSAEACDVLGLFATNRHPHAQEIDLTNCGITAGGMDSFCRSFFSNASSDIVKMKFTKNPLGRDGVLCARDWMRKIMRKGGLNNLNEIETLWYEAVPGEDDCVRVLELYNRLQIRVFLQDIPDSAITDGMSMGEVDETYFSPLDRDDSDPLDGHSVSLGQNLSNNIYTMFSTMSIRHPIEQDDISTFDPSAHMGTLSTAGTAGYLSAQSGQSPPRRDILATLGTLASKGETAISESERLLVLCKRKYKVKFSRHESAGALLGSGTHGSVYSGWCLKTAKCLAIKCIDVRDPADAVLVKEAELMRKLSHKHVVKFFGCVYDTHEGDAPLDDSQQQREVPSTVKSLYIVMERMESSVSDVIGRMFSDKRVNDDLTATWGAQILAGLAYLHSHGVVHRDVKPANILYDGRDGVKLSDFSCSQVLLLENSGTVVPVPVGVKGTPAYIAPETLHSGYCLGAASDVWSFGCTLLEFLTGAPPWSRSPHFKNTNTLLTHILSSGATPEVPSEVDSDLRNAILSCLDRDPLRRPTSDALTALDVFEYDDD